MKYQFNYEEVIAIKTTSSLYNEPQVVSRVFKKNTPISVIIEWAHDCSGDLKIVPNDTGTVLDELERNYADKEELLPF